MMTMIAENIWNLDNKMCIMKKQYSPTLTATMKRHHIHANGVASAASRHHQQRLIANSFASHVFVLKGPSTLRHDLVIARTSRLW